MNLLIVHDWDGAIADFSAVIGVTPENGGAFSGRAEAYQAKGDYNLALADRTAAIKPPSRDPKAIWPNEGSLCAGRGCPDLEAIRDFDDALTLKPEDFYRAYILHLRGWAHGLKKEWDQAIADYTLALGIPAKDNYSALFALIGRSHFVAHWAAGSKMFLGLITARRSVSITSIAPAKSDRAYYVQNARGDFDQAIADRSELRQRDPTGHALACSRQGLAYLRKGKLTGRSPTSIVRSS